MSNDPPIEESLFKSMMRSDLKEVGLDFSELALDAILDDGLVKDIPVIGTLAKLGSAIGSIRERLLAKKLLYFLLEMETVPYETRRQQMRWYMANPREQQRHGEQILLMLDQLNEMKKATLVARVFLAYLATRIDHTQFQALCFAISRVNTALLPDFKSRCECSGAPVYDHAGDSEFYHCGLLALRFAGVNGGNLIGIGVSEPSARFEVSETGRLFYDVVLRGTTFSAHPERTYTYP